MISTRTLLKLVLLPLVALGFSLATSAQGINCGGAVAVTPGTYTANGPSSGNGPSNLCFPGVPNATNSDWYVYTPAASGTIDVASCLGGADTRLSIYSGTCAALVCEGSNDDACPTTAGGPGFASEVLALPVTAGNDYYIEWDDRWTTLGFDWTLNFNCGNAPTATDSIVLDCANNQWFVEVTITSLGSATGVDIGNNAGAPVISNVGLGVYQVGPFALGTTAQYNLTNLQDPGCDFFSASIDHFPCPIVSCGPDQYNFCYTSNMDSVAVYQSPNSFALAMVFNSGTMDQFGDAVTIYDGPDDQSPVLFSGSNGGDLTGLLFISTNPGNFLTFQISSDGFSDCAGSGGLYDPIDYTVSCLNCTNPGATYSVNTDCVHREWFIDVDIDSTGNAPSVHIVNSYNNDTIFGAGTGVTSVGPFPLDTAYNVTVLNSLNVLCRQNSPSLIATTDTCVIVTCGIDNYSHCYENDEDAWYTFKRDSVNFGAGQITVNFLSGQMVDIEDRVIIYNGKTDLANVVANSNFGGSLAGQAFTSNNPGDYLTVRFISNSSSSCSDGSVSGPIFFDVGCGAVGVDELEATDLVIYPNPANDRLFMNFAGLSTNAQIQVFDAVGALVIQTNASFQNGMAVELPVSELGNGNYFLQVISDDVFKAQRFQISR